LNPKLEALITEKGWKDLTEIQKSSLERIMKGENTLIIAPTGYGKTEAALLPILNMMLEIQPKPVSVLYITPLKALINDLMYRISWWAERLGFLVSRKHAEVPQKEKNSRLRRIPHIVVTTPEGLEVDLDWATRFREYYKNVKWVIIDEVHELITSKRGAQLLILLERLKDLAGDFVRIGLSATIGDENKIAELLFGSSSRKGIIIKSNDSKYFELRISKINNNEGDLWRSSAKYLTSAINPPTLIFTNSRFSTERLHEELEKIYMSGDGIYVHHSSISRDMKTKVEESLRSGRAKVVICTRTLELGIDIGKINKVIMYRPPPTVSSFLQRLGRSGHSKESVSRGEIVCTYDYEVLESLALYSLGIEGILEKPKIYPYLDVVAREVLGIILQYGKVDINHIYNLIKSSKLYSNLSVEKYLDLIKLLNENNLIKLNENKASIGPMFFRIWRFEKDKRGWGRGFSEFFSFIKNDETFYVKYNDIVIGEIDSIYVYKHIRPSDVIRISGKHWRVSRIDPNKMIIEVIPVNEGEGEVPIWKGENISKSMLLPTNIEYIINNVNYYESILDENSKQTIKEFLNYYKRNNLPLPSRDLIYVEKYNDEWVYSTLIEEEVSNTIAHLLLYLGIKERGFNVQVRSSIYGFSIRGVGKDLLSEIRKLDELQLRKYLIRAIIRSPLFHATLKEIKHSFGKIGKVDRNKDKLIFKEALKQTIFKYFNVRKTLKYIRKLKSNKINIIYLEGLSKLGEAVLNTAPIRPWTFDILSTIYSHLKGGAYTVKELSEILGISTKTLESKLKYMRRPDSRYRVVSFIDVETKELRWCLLEDFEEIYKSEDYVSSFSPINFDEVYIVVMKSLHDNNVSELIIKVKDVVEDPILFSKKLPYDSIAEMRIKDPHDPLVYNVSPKYFYIDKRIAPYLILNAITYIQTIKYI
jgi:ATP-dependent Lhr-like helicase